MSGEKGTVRSGPKLPVHLPSKSSSSSSECASLSKATNNNYNDDDIIFIDTLEKINEIEKSSNNNRSTNEEEENEEEEEEPLNYTQEHDSTLNYDDESSVFFSKNDDEKDEKGNIVTKNNMSSSSSSESSDDDEEDQDLKSLLMGDRELLDKIDGKLKEIIDLTQSENEEEEEVEEDKKSCKRSSSISSYFIKQNKVKVEKEITSPIVINHSSSNQSLSKRGAKQSSSPPPLPILIKSENKSASMDCDDTESSTDDTDLLEFLKKDNGKEEEVLKKVDKSMSQLSFSSDDEEVKSPPIDFVKRFGEKTSTKPPPTTTPKSSRKKPPSENEDVLAMYPSCDIKTKSCEIITNKRATMLIEDLSSSPTSSPKRPKITVTTSSGSISTNQSPSSFYKPSSLNKRAQEQEQIIKNNQNNIQVTKQKKEEMVVVVADNENENEAERKRNEMREIFRSRKEVTAAARTTKAKPYIDVLKNLKCKETTILFNRSKSAKRPFESSDFGLTQSLRLAKLENQVRIESKKYKESMESSISLNQNINLVNKAPTTTSTTTTTTTTTTTKSELQKRSQQQQQQPKPKLLIQLQPPPTTSTSTTCTTKTTTSKENHLNEIMNNMNKQAAQLNAAASRSSINPLIEDNATRYSFENFLYRILKCTYNWLNEQTKMKAPPPVVSDQELMPMIDSYLGYDDYYKAIFPLLLIETWEEITRAWKEIANNKNSANNHQLLWIKSIDKIHSHSELVSINCQTIVNPGVKTQQLFEEDLLRLNIDMMINGNQKEKQDVFGIVYKTQKYRPDESAVMQCVRDSLKKITSDSTPSASSTSASSSSTTYSNSKTLKNNSPYYVNQLSIYVRSRKYATEPGVTLDHECITSLASTFRRARALSSFHSSPLRHSLLKININDSIFWFRNDNDKEKEKIMKSIVVNDGGEYNESQQEVIVEASSIINYDDPKLYFIQGPPGTGKSHTIIGIIKAIYARLNTKEPNKNAAFKLLICSPSNGGCDELTRRIVRLIRSGRLLFLKRNLRVVRAGRTESMHKDCDEVCLDALTRRKYDEMMKKKELEKSSSLQEHYTKMRSMEVALERQIKSLRSGSNSNECMLRDLEAQLTELRAKIQKFDQQLNSATTRNNRSAMEKRRDEQRARELVFKEADVIICTLNFSGNSMFDCLLADKNNGQALVNAVIIDEAAQCLEVECLIPLRFNCMRIVLVGDPEQLPATVLCKRAQDKGLAQSLFERVYQNFRFHEPSPIRMLFVQYRMHETICQFPSFNFYKGKLCTNAETTAKRSMVDLRPYLIMNVSRSQEIGDEETMSGSIYNPLEAEAVIDLCKCLTKKQQNFNIGIITPYQRQTQHLREILNQCNFDRVEVGTVDSYQGREKDIIILSTVRANANQNIGFLANRQRLNVSLTRARYALYICCNVETLRGGSEDWRRCIENAQQRNLICQI